MSTDKPVLPPDRQERCLGNAKGIELRRPFHYIIESGYYHVAFKDVGQ
jgi:hypothetical protein